LAGRLIVDDPDGLDEVYPVARREHGTAMASLIIHGDLNHFQSGLNRRVCGKLVPNLWGVNVIACDCLIRGN
jgi:hypothetical protein